MDKGRIDIRIDWNTRHNMRNFIPKYIKDLDTFIAQPSNPVPSIAVDCGGDMWFLVIPDTGEIVGVEIEGFKKVFLKKYAELLRDKPKNEIETIANFIDEKLCPAYV
jgi:hypothetical protein